MYSQSRILTEKLGNNAFAWDEREKKYGASPTLTIPSLIEWTLDNVKIGDDIVFEEVENGVLKSCRGLENFIQLAKNPTFQKSNIPIIIFDNHNHALYFWIDAIKQWILEPGFELIHIDEHSDLWDNPNELDLQKAIEDSEYAWRFTNLECNVGNYIQPALRSGLVGSMIRIENEYQLDEYMNSTPGKNSVLNLDLDIFTPELDHIPEDKKMNCIRSLLPKVWYVTIAISPFFIDQWIGIQKLKTIFDDLSQNQ